MKSKIGIIGGGNMGAAIISGIFKKYAVRVSETDSKRKSFLKKKFQLTADSIEDVIKYSDVIILAVKPQSFNDILEDIRPFVTKNKLIISIAAGITSKYIEKRLCDGVRVVRVMPNLPVQVQQGISGLCLGKYAKSQDLIVACKLFTCIGHTVVVQEKHMDAITAVSGSGPAYVFLFVEAFVKAAKSIGLNEKISPQLVFQTLKGSVMLMKELNEDAGVLRKRVTSKKGTTEAALNVFSKLKYEKIFVEALKAAKKRAKELAK